MLARCRSIEDVDKTVTEIQDRMRDADEIAEAISSTNYSGVEIDPVSTYISSHFHNSSHLMYYRTNSRTSSRSWSSRSSTMFSQKPTIPQYTFPQLRRLHRQRVRVSSFHLPFHDLFICRTSGGRTGRRGRTQEVASRACYVTSSFSFIFILFHGPSCLPDLSSHCSPGLPPTFLYPTYLVSACKLTLPRTSRFPPHALVCDYTYISFFTSFPEADFLQMHHYQGSSLMFTPLLVLLILCAIICNIEYPALQFLPNRFSLCLISWYPPICPPPIIIMNSPRIRSPRPGQPLEEEETSLFQLDMLDTPVLFHFLSPLTLRIDVLSLLQC